MIPTSIDGTDITGATIDGTDVQEITVDGQTVFSAVSNLPVAYSNLIAWYPFDSATYGGSNADDVTAILGGSGDDTAFDGTVDDATYDSNGGVTDIQAGTNSGAFSFVQQINNTTAIGDAIDLPLFNLNVGTVCVWVNPDSLDGGNLFFIGTNNSNFIGWRSNSSEFYYRENGNTPTITTPETLSTNQWTHLAWSTDGSNIKSWFNGTPYGPVSASENMVFDELGYPYDFDGGNRFSLDGHADDLRVYNKQLSDSEVSQIYQNTEP